MTALTLPLSPRGEGGGEGVFDLGDWNLFEIWCLGFGASIWLTFCLWLQCVFQCLGPTVDLFLFVHLCQGDEEMMIELRIKSLQGDTT